MAEDTLSPLILDKNNSTKSESTHAPNDAYTLLGINKHATTEEIEAAYDFLTTELEDSDEKMHQSARINITAATK